MRRRLSARGARSCLPCKAALVSCFFMADIWKPKTQWDSRYLWMPLQIGDGKLWLPEPREWTLDVQTGETVIKTAQ